MRENTELSELQRRLHDAHESSSRLRDTITRLEAEKVMLAKLAAETPQFFNPWHCAEAIKLRDAVLANDQVDLTGDAGGPNSKKDVVAG